jgi:hypothetical protein
MTVKLEARPYGPDSTPEEIQAIKNRVYVYAPGILMYQEAPVMSTFQLDLFEERLNELSAGMDSYLLLIDLTEVEPPGAEIRKRLKQLFGGQTKLKKTAVFTGRNFMLNVTAKFVLGGVGIRNFTVHKTLEEAHKALET